MADSFPSVEGIADGTSAKNVSLHDLGRSSQRVSATFRPPVRPCDLSEQPIIRLSPEMQVQAQHCLGGSLIPRPGDDDNGRTSQPVLPQDACDGTASSNGHPRTLKSNSVEDAFSGVVDNNPTAAAIDQPDCNADDLPISEGDAEERQFVDNGVCEVKEVHDGIVGTVAENTINDSLGQRSLTTVDQSAGTGTKLVQHDECIKPEKENDESWITSGPGQPVSSSAIDAAGSSEAVGQPSRQSEELDANCMRQQLEHLNALVSKLCDRQTQENMRVAQIECELRDCRETVRRQDQQLEMLRETPAKLAQAEEKLAHLECLVRQHHQEKTDSKPKMLHCDSASDAAVVERSPAVSVSDVERSPAASVSVSGTSMAGMDAADYPVPFGSVNVLQVKWAADFSLSLTNRLRWPLVVAPGSVVVAGRTVHQTRPTIPRLYSGGLPITGLLRVPACSRLLAGSPSPGSACAAVLVKSSKLPLHQCLSITNSDSLPASQGNKNEDCDDLAKDKSTDETVEAAALPAAASDCQQLPAVDNGRAKQLDADGFRRLHEHSAAVRKQDSQLRMQVQQVDDNVQPMHDLRDSPKTIHRLEREGELREANKSNNDGSEQRMLRGHSPVSAAAVGGRSLLEADSAVSGAFTASVADSGAQYGGTVNVGQAAKAADSKVLQLLPVTAVELAGVVRQQVQEPAGSSPPCNRDHPPRHSTLQLPACSPPLRGSVDHGAAVQRMVAAPLMPVKSYIVSAHSPYLLCAQHDKDEVPLQPSLPKLSRLANSLPLLGSNPVQSSTGVPRQQPLKSVTVSAKEDRLPAIQQDKDKGDAASCLLLSSSTTTLRPACARATPFNAGGCQKLTIDRSSYREHQKLCWHSTDGHSDCGLRLTLRGMQRIEAYVKCTDLAVTRDGIVVAATGNGLRLYDPVELREVHKFGDRQAYRCVTVVPDGVNCTDGSAHADGGTILVAGNKSAKILELLALSGTWPAVRCDVAGVLLEGHLPWCVAVDRQGRTASVSSGRFVRTVPFDGSGELNKIEIGYTVSALAYGSQALIVGSSEKQDGLYALEARDASNIDHQLWKLRFNEAICGLLCDRDSLCYVLLARSRALRMVSAADGTQLADVNLCSRLPPLAIDVNDRFMVFLLGDSILAKFAMHDVQRTTC